MDERDHFNTACSERLPKKTKVTRSLAWPDPIFVQGVYRLQYKRPHEKGLEQFTGSTGSDTS